MMSDAWPIIYGPSSIMARSVVSTRVSLCAASSPQECLRGPARMPGRQGRRPSTLQSRSAAPCMRKVLTRAAKCVTLCHMKRASVRDPTGSPLEMNVSTMAVRISRSQFPKLGSAGIRHYVSNLNPSSGGPGRKLPVHS